MKKIKQFIYRLFCFLPLLLIFAHLNHLEARVGAKHIGHAIPRFDHWLKKNGISETYSDYSLKNLERKFEKKKEIFQEDDGEFPFIEKGLENCQTLKTHKFESTKDRQELYLITLRILYTIMVSESEEKSLSTRDRVTSKLDFLKTLFQLVSKHDGIKVRVPKKGEERRAIGAKNVRKEAKFLRNSQGEFVSKRDMVRMSPRQISRLDIGENHPAWMSYKSFLKSREERELRHEKLTKWYEKKIEEKIKEKEDKEVDYKAIKAKRVVFFDDLKPTGTSPKAKVRDGYNQKWKIKFSAEDQTEPFASRLMMAAGAKVTDLVYNNIAGAEGTTLILRGDGGSDNLCNPKTYNDFIACFKGRPFKIDLRPFVYSKGIITKENLNQVIRYLPKDSMGLKVRKKEDLIGKTYITFKESSLKLLTKKGVKRGAATSFSHLGAREDRLARGILLMNMWIGNGDTKDANNKSYIAAKNYPFADNKDEKHYLETIHDLGLTLGGIIGGGGDISRFNTGKKFVKRKNNFLHFNQFVAFVPESYETATYADLLWMGRFIGSISFKEIQEMAKTTNWPTFMQEVLVFRLVSRRNEIMRVLHLTHEFGILQVKRPNIIYHYEESNPAYEKLVTQYPILKERLKSYCQRQKRKGFRCVDQVVKHGKVRKKSFIVKTLEKELFPVGLSWRRPRFSALIPIAKKVPL